MSYFDEVDAWLTAVLLPLDEAEDEEEWFSRVKKQIKAKILESYRNGQKAGEQPADSPSHGKPRADGGRKFPFRFRGNRKQ